MSSLERLLGPHCNEGPECRCGEEMKLARTERLPDQTDAHIRIADVPLFVEHCEAVAAEIDVKLRWLGEQARRELSVWSDALPVRHVMLEVVCEPSVVGSL